MPSMDTFWECDTGKEDKPNYVRTTVGEGSESGDDTEAEEAECSSYRNGRRYAAINIDKIDEWDRLVLMVRAQYLHSIQIKVIDVDRKDAWDEVKGVLGGVVDVAVGLFNKFLGLNLGTTQKDASLALPKTNVAADSLGGARDDVRSFTLKRLAGGDDVLYRGSVALGVSDKSADSASFGGRGKDGCYALELEWKKEETTANGETEPSA